MVPITHKSYSLRKAIALSKVIVSNKETIELIQKKQIPKGDIFEFARAASLLGIKKTSDIIPDCHPLPIEFASVSFDIVDLEIHIKVEVHTIYKTGIEVESMHGASVAALTIYDMLKPIDKGVYIGTIRLLSKKGGKSDFQKHHKEGIKAAIVVCSDSVSKKIAHDTAGLKAKEKLVSYNIEVLYHETIPDDYNLIQERAKKYASMKDCHLVLFVGGTGLSKYDLTPDAVQPLLTRVIPGIMEVARAYGQQRTPFSMLSRGIAGFLGDTLILTLPGSPKGTSETIDALFPHILHVFKIAEGARHD